MKTCKDFPGECCASCHDDDDEGWRDLLEVYGDSGDVLARICCRKVSAALARTTAAESTT
jgi:hypothetical protein